VGNRLADTVLERCGFGNRVLVACADASFLAETVRALGGSGAFKLVSIARGNNVAFGGKTAHVILEHALGAWLASASLSLGVAIAVQAGCASLQRSAHTIGGSSRLLQHVHGRTAVSETGTLAVRRLGRLDGLVLVVTTFGQRFALGAVVTNAVLEGSFRARIALAR
jgi:hypothetical protein